MKIKTDNRPNAEMRAADILCDECVCPRLQKAIGCHKCKPFEALQQYFIDYESSKLDELSWAEISDIAAAGKAAEQFRVGDTKTIELYTGEAVTLVILGFDHDTLGDETGKAAITFGLLDCLDGEYEMNANDTNMGGWNSSKMRSTYMERFARLLPSELQAVIKTVKKPTSIGNDKSDIIESHDNLFLFSEVEVTGEAEYSAKYEGKQYPYFKDGDTWVKHRNKSAAVWWLRSPNVSSSAYFRYIITAGGVGGASAGSAVGVSLGFCI